MAAHDHFRDRCLLVGAVGAGKTTLMHALNDDPDRARKTQVAEYVGACIDTPGEYAEIVAFRSRLVALSNEARLLVVLHDATRERSCFPPGFVRIFPCPAIGLVTKIDLPGADVVRATALLREAGVEGEIHPVSATLGTGMAALRQRLSSCLAGRNGENDNGNCSG
ncbi:MAG: ethanolamine utilization protein EutP [Phyllobacteriaceae bacterium]|nr:ethanolamine utilization protein EutP [Phyllobacteriaceae bacterium]